jgi:AcrR family transcriptional regulator
MAGWRPLRHRPRARFNGPQFAVRRRGFRTVGEICEAAGIPKTTFDRWEGSIIPKLPRVEGMRVVPEAEFARYVEVCREAYAKRSRRTGSA